MSIHYSLITQFLPHELTMIEQLYRDAGWWEDEYDTQWLCDLPRTSTLYVVARENEHIVGMGRLLSDGVSDGYIQDIAVLKTHRGHAIGRAIVRMLLEAAKGRGIDWIALIGSPGTQAFYKHLGFAVMKDHIPMHYQGE